MGSLGSAGSVGSASSAALRPRGPAAPAASVASVASALLMPLGRPAETRPHAGRRDSALSCFSETYGR